MRTNNQRILVDSFAIKQENVFIILFIKDFIFIGDCEKIKTFGVDVSGKLIGKCDIVLIIL